jgi:hypothetical protein
MSDLKIVQFVCFETTLDKGEFIKRWEEYQRSADSDANIRLMQCEKDQSYRYLVQHTCTEGELRFVFSKANHSSRTRRAIVTARQAGGYMVLQSETTGRCTSSENRIFVFFTSPRIDLEACRQGARPGKLNIYEAYYENCSYAYILEIVVKSKDLSVVLEQVGQCNPAEIDVYREFSFQPSKVY